MQELKSKAERDNEIMRVMKVNEIRHVIAHTDKGDLCLMIRKEGKAKDYQFLLDSVPFEKEINDKLMEVFDGTLFSI